MEAVTNHYGHQPVSNTSLICTPETQRASAATAQRTPKRDTYQVQPLCQYNFSTDASIGENKHIEEFNICLLPDLCLQRIFSFCSPFDFPNLRKTCKRFANNSENTIVKHALITTAADNLQKISFFDKLRNNDLEGRKGMAFASALDNLVNIPESSTLRGLDNYKIALSNFIQQINWIFKAKQEKTRISQQPDPYEKLIFHLITFVRSRIPKERQSSLQWLAKIHWLDGWEVLHKTPNNDTGKIIFINYIYFFKPANNGWNQLALVSILKTIRKIKAEQSSAIYAEAFEKNREEAIAAIIYAILEAPRQQDVRDQAATLEALYDTPLEPQWKTSLELAGQVLLLDLHRNIKGLRYFHSLRYNHPCSGQELASVLDTLHKDPFGNTRLLRRAKADTIFAIRQNPNTKTWDRQTLAAVFKGLLKTTPDQIKRPDQTEQDVNKLLRSCMALIIHEIKTRVTDWDTLILTTLINSAGVETANTGAGENDLSGQNPKMAKGAVSAMSGNRIKSRKRPLPDDSASESVPEKAVKTEPCTISKNSAMAKAHQLSAIRHITAQQTPDGQPAIPNQWQDGLALAVGLEALLAMTVEAAANPLWQDDWEMAIKNFLAAIRYTASNYTSSIALAAALEVLQKVPVNSRWADDWENATASIIEAIRNFHISTRWTTEDFANVLQAFNKINTPVSQSLETSLVQAGNEIFTAICHYVDFSVRDNVFSYNLFVRMGFHNMPAVLDALFSTPAELPWRQNLAEAKLAVFKIFQFCVDTAQDSANGVKAALMALKVVEAVPVPEEQELADARALFIESARKRLPQSSENCQYQSEES